MRRSTQTLLTTIATELSSAESLCGLFHEHRDGDPLPSQPELAEAMDLCRSILFPGFYGKSNVNEQNLVFHIGVALERLYVLLCEQIQAGLCFATGWSEVEAYGESYTSAQDTRKHKASELARQFVKKLPQLRQTLATDVEAAYLGDPAAETYGEVISCYPIIKAITNYRIAHELLQLGVPLIPRIITEMAHSETGIDIHPAATIGHHFTIDHGTGVVVGATCIIGNNVKLYQGVTLGAKSFPVDDKGNPIKGIPRHPILEDGVIVYANSTILGRITIGRGAVIGGNIWVTEDVAPGARILQNKYCH
ncbi:MAG: serine acetyltransferase [Bacteroidaceae bacterium]|jgi:serine O-acetyltransferase|nr:serine acetyltransferase [Bacteroidaceae bacterium]